MFGPAFFDSVSDYQTSRRLTFQIIKPWRVSVIWWIVLILGMLILSSRLIYLQVIRGVENRQLADEQRIRTAQIPAARGLIVDRNGNNLVQNQPIFREIKVTPESGVQLSLVTREQALAMEANGYGANLVEAVGRRYLYGPSTAHILGYLGEVNAKELADKDKNYQISDLIGRGGVEGAFDTWLRGINGEKLIEVDTTGKLVRQAGSKVPIPGRKLALTIDINLQQTIYKLLEEQKATGAVVVSQPNTGEVLAMVSYPSYDPAVFSPSRTADTSDQIIGLLNDTSRPLVNRTIAAVYPPGSTFKLITAAAALQTGAIQSDFTYKDTGVIKVGEYEYKNWYLSQYGGKEGVIDLPRAIARSTDTFFYKVGEIVGPVQMADWARKMGLGSRTAINLPEELKGLVPDPDWKLQTIGERWYLGNTYHMAIGQGDLLATPAQINQMTAVFANHGFLCPLHITDTSEISEAQDPTACHSVGLSDENLDYIIQGMVLACSPGGTAYPFFNYQPQVACKTGTAEFGPANDKGIRQTHAWLTAFAPAEKPEIVVTVLLESGGEGSRDAAPIAKQIIKKYFGQDLKSRIVSEKE